MKKERNLSKDAEIRENLKEAIRLSGLERKDIADQVGIKYGTLSDYINRGTMPSLVTFAKICEVLDVSSDEILNIKLSDKS